MEPVRSVSRCSLLLAALVSVSSCQVWVGEYAADRQDPVSVDAMCALEQSTFEFSLDLESEQHLETLQDYYAEANPDFLEHFTTVAEAYSDDEELRSATYILGEAGVGKSFVIRRLFEAFPSDVTCELELAKLLSAPNERFPTQRAADLTTIDGSVVFNELPGFTAPDGFSLPRFLEEHDCVDATLILLDGMDEIHPKSARVILRSIEEYLTETDARFLHIVVTGRPEGFSPWLADPMRGDRTSKVARLLRLRTPVYDTLGDIGFRLEEYLRFAELLSDVERDGSLDKYTRRVAGYLERFPFLRYSLGNLAVGNVVLLHTMPNDSETEQALKADIFADLVARNADTHGRPGVGSRWDSTYLDALEDVAAQYVELNDRGEFSVGPTDEVPLFDATGKLVGTTLVSALLERSGLAYLASPTSTTKRFAFSPFWVHSYLAERHNARAVPKYQVRGCP